MAKKARKYVRKDKAERKNLKLWAQGVREDILAPHIEPFADALQRGWVHGRKYLQSVLDEYHALISWRLEDHEEPELPLPCYDPSAVRPYEDLTVEELVAKHKRVEEIDHRIRRWLIYRIRKLRREFGPKLNPKKDPFAMLLSKLSGLKPPNKARQGWQQYMHESYSSSIGPEVKRQWDKKVLDEKLSADETPNAPFRAAVARSMFNSLLTEEQDAIRSRAREEAQTARTAFDRALKAPPSKLPADRQKAIDGISDFLYPIITGLQERTGCKFLILYGGPTPKYNGTITTNHLAWGRNLSNSPCVFSKWQPDRFSSDVLDFFKEWLNTAYTPKDIEEAALPANNEDLLAGLQPMDTGDGIDNDEDSDEDGDEDSDEDSEGDSDTENQPHPSTRKSKRPRVPAKKTSVPRSKATTASRQPATKASGLDNANPPASSNPQTSVYEQTRAHNVRRNQELLDSLGIPQALRNLGLASRTPSASLPKPTPLIIPPPPVQPQHPEAVNSPIPLNNESMDVDPATEFDEVDPPSSPIGTLIPVQPHQRAPSVPEPVHWRYPPIPPLPGFAYSQPANLTTPTPVAEVTPTSPQGAVSPPVPGRCSSLCPPSAPDWFQTAHSALTDEDLGPQFDTLVTRYTAIEAAHRFEKGTKYLSAKFRPPEVTQWLTAKRAERPKITSLDKFSKAWWKWWSSLQPSWRARSESGVFTRNNDYGEDWSKLVVPGQNGLLNIVVTLQWWGCIASGMSEEERLKWINALEDVDWMFAGLLSHLQYDE